MIKLNLILKSNFNKPSEMKYNLLVIVRTDLIKISISNKKISLQLIGRIVKKQELMFIRHLTIRNNLATLQSLQFLLMEMQLTAKIT